MVRSASGALYLAIQCVTNHTTHLGAMCNYDIIQ